MVKSHLTEKEVAVSLNNYFTTIARSLVNKISLYSGKFGERQVQQFYYEKGVSPSSFLFNKVTESSVQKQLCGFDYSKAAGLENIPTRCLKDTAEIADIGGKLRGMMFDFQKAFNTVDHFILLMKQKQK